VVHFVVRDWISLTKWRLLCNSSSQPTVWVVSEELRVVFACVMQDCEFLRIKVIAPQLQSGSFSSLSSIKITDIKMYSCTLVTVVSYRCEC